MSHFQTLETVFGFTAYKPGQEAVVEKIMAGQSAVAIFPTGAGKSLCYQLPALHEPGMALVVSPLLSLMKDQLAFLATRQIPAAKLDSGMSTDDYRKTLEAARQGKLKILMIAVERFNNERFRTQLARMPVSLLVVDEAHCISEWGHNFRPDYLKIPIFQNDFNIPKALLLTATATPQVVADMCYKFSIPDDNVIRTGFYRKNLFLDIVPTRENEKNAHLRQLLSRDPAGPAIVYVTLQKTAEQVARMLVQNGFDAAAYHAGMKNEAREAVQNRFMAGDTGVVVATIAFGMGIDKENIRKVIHYDLPKSMEGYSQEIGRAGRDGAPALCSVLANRNSIPVLENFIYGDTPHKEGISRVLAAIKASPTRRLEVRPHLLSREADIRLLPLKTLLVYLEMENVIAPKYTFFEQYPFKFISDPKDIAEKFVGERKTFVQALLENTKTAKTWTYPDIDAAMAATGSPRKRVLAALEYFDEQGYIELAPKSGVEVYDIRMPDFDENALAGKLIELFAGKESRDVARIHHMIRLFETDQCLSKNLSAHFGEKLAQDCGHCAVCRGQSPGRLPSDELAPLSEFDGQTQLAPLETAADGAVPVHLATRFLCGIATPRLVQLKAKGLPGYSCMEQYPYKTVEQWVAEHYRKQH